MDMTLPRSAIAVAAVLAALLGLACASDVADAPLPTQPPGLLPNVPLSISGSLTLDGEFLDGDLLGVVVRRDGLEAACLSSPFTTADGEYRVSVVSETEVRGCGLAGAQLYLFVSADGFFLVSRQLAIWPDDSTTLSFNASFSRAEAEGVGNPASVFTGTVTDGSGEALPAGTVIEAFVGDTLCGVTSLPAVGMALFGTGEYYVIVQGPDGIPECASDEEVTFRIDGEPAEQTAVNDLQEESHELDLTLP